ncbi:MAG: DsbA family protein [Rubellimicrobium sp.]|nr:DsbA family protein [Rubellimicrobium sp.]
MKPALPIAALASALVLGGAWFLTQPSGSQSTGFDLPGAAQAQGASAEIDISTVAEMTLGDPDAPVTVIYYASLTCPHCASFHANQLKSLKSEFIDTGKVHFIYRDVYFDRFGLWASMVARCGGESRFFGITEMLYDQQVDWIAGGDPGLISENLRRIGRTAGLEDAAIEACLTDETMAQTLIAWFQDNAERDGINSTPSLVINGERHSNMAFNDLAELINAALEG